MRAFVSLKPVFVNCIGKSLKDELEGLRSYRISRFRIIYRISANQIIEVVAIGPRQPIYEETYRIIKKEAHQ